MISKLSEPVHLERVLSDLLNDHSCTKADQERLHINFMENLQSIMKRLNTRTGHIFPDLPNQLNGNVAVENNSFTTKNSKMKA